MTALKAIAAIVAMAVLMYLIFGTHAREVSNTPASVDRAISECANYGGVHSVLTLQSDLGGSATVYVRCVQHVSFEWKEKP